MIEIDGSHGEGGGMILRNALALSVHTGKAFKLNNIRANRPKPGMKMQHLKALHAAKELCSAKVSGNKKGSTEVTFEPHDMKSKTLRIDIETAGSITLLLQALVLPCTFSLNRYKLEITGGTDVKWSPSFDYFKFVFLPHLKKYADIELDLEKRGYYPKGGGKVKMKIKGGGEPDDEIELTRRKELMQIRGVSHASTDMADDEMSDKMAKNAELLLSPLGVPVNIMREYANINGSGGGMTLWALHGDDENGIDFQNPMILGADALWEPSKKPEGVAEEAVNRIRELVESEAVADPNLADNLIPFLAVARGEMKTSEVTEHTKSSIYVAKKFLDVEFEVKDNLITAL